MSLPAKRNLCLEHYDSGNGGQGFSCLLPVIPLLFHHPELLRGLVGETPMATAAIVDKRVQEGSILAVPEPSNRRSYPTLQFNGDGAVVPGLKAVRDALQTSNPWTILNFLSRPDSRLDNCKPVDLLRSGKLDIVLKAARRHGEQGGVSGPLPPADRHGRCLGEGGLHIEPSGGLHIASRHATLTMYAEPVRALVVDCPPTNLVTFNGAECLEQTGNAPPPFHGRCKSHLHAIEGQDVLVEIIGRAVVRQRHHEHIRRKWLEES